MGIFKRILSAVLAVCMVISLCPPAAAAEPGTNTASVNRIELAPDASLPPEQTQPQSSPGSDEDSEPDPDAVSEETRTEPSVT